MNRFKFKEAERIPIEECLNQLVDKINELEARLAQLESRRSVPQQYGYPECSCDVEYTGAHRYECIIQQRSKK